MLMLFIVLFSVVPVISFSNFQAIFPLISSQVFVILTNSHQIIFQHKS